MSPAIPAIPAGGPVDRPRAPLAGGEAATLLGFLEHHRATLRWKVGGLSTEQLRAAPLPSSLTLVGLLKHLAYVEDWWSGVVLSGRGQAPPFDTAPWDDDPDWELTSARADDPADVLALWESRVAAARDDVDAALAREGLDTPSAIAHPRTGERASLRWILVHLIEEYARHNGHADLLREAIDGTTGC
ncbi:DinB family protein [Nocardioides sp.]|uniref:DinB family protein n=1 Tax=Nocardioides sp. TaxID=35761 RepID=UPI003513FD24